MFQSSFLVLAVAYIVPATTLWSCSNDSDCALTEGSECVDGACACPVGQQAVLGGSLCAHFSPYHTSTCVEDHQCWRLGTTYECRKTGEELVGTCQCQPGHHYYLTRCWRTAVFGQLCVTNDQCLSVRDPNSMVCDGVCVCAPGYYERQRGECRKAGLDVGDGCVLDGDCQFDGGFCDWSTFTCTHENATEAILEPEELSPDPDLPIIHGASCVDDDSCADPFVCSLGVCVCPTGYYPGLDGAVCYAELGSPVSTSWQCDGIFSVAVAGVCTCPANFPHDQPRRDCAKVARTISDSCVSDENCFTFGDAARCGLEQEFGMRSCECNPELAVWDESRHICRLFVGVGEECEVDFDCLAGELEIQCVPNEEGQGICTCPDGLIAIDGLCLTTGLSLGDACQVTVECSETPNTICSDGRCSCDAQTHQEVDGACAPIIGGACAQDTDCVIEHTVCQHADDVSACRCGEGFVAYDQQCWPVSAGFEKPCNVSVQCTSVLGDSTTCTGAQCVCLQGYHYRDSGCWRVTGLFEQCRRTSECFLEEGVDRVVCRNSLCQCDFKFPYSEETKTCVQRSEAVSVFGNFFVLTIPMVITFQLFR